MLALGFAFQILTALLVAIASTQFLYAQSFASVDKDKFLEHSSIGVYCLVVGAMFFLLLMILRNANKKRRREQIIDQIQQAFASFLQAPLSDAQTKALESKWRSLVSPPASKPLRIYNFTGSVCIILYVFVCLWQFGPGKVSTWLGIITSVPILLALIRHPTT